MNQGAEPDIGDAYQTLKYTKMKMREIIARIEADQENQGRASDDQVSII